MYNKVVMIGNLTRDIELRYLPSGSAVGKSAIATSHKYKTQTGEQKDEVCFLDFNMFGRTAEIANQYLKKGSKVLLEGRLVLEQWTGTDGQNRTKHSLRVEELKMLDSKPSGEQSHSSGNDYQPRGNTNPQVEYQRHPEASATSTGNSQQAYIPEYDINDDEIPF